MVTLVSFVFFTVIIVNPLLTLAFLFFYFINISGLFLNKDDSLRENEQLYNYGKRLIINVFKISHLGIKFVNPPLEMGFMIFTLTFFLLLIPSRYILRL